MGSQVPAWGNFFLHMDITLRIPYRWSTVFNDITSRPSSSFTSRPRWRPKVNHSLNTAHSSWMFKMTSRRNESPSPWTATKISEIKAIGRQDSYLQDSDTPSTCTWGTCWRPERNECNSSVGLIDTQPLPGAGAKMLNPTEGLTPFTETSVSRFRCTLCEVWITLSEKRGGYSFRFS